MKRIVVTGASGLLGWHATIRLHAANCVARSKNLPIPYDIVALDRSGFQDAWSLQVALAGADAVLHFAGVSRAPEFECENITIAQRLLEFCHSVEAKPHVVYANSIHSRLDTPYGRSKRIAGEVLEAITDRYTNLILPHIYGEGAKPFYNNVTATIIHQLIAGKEPVAKPKGHVQLLYAGAAAQIAIDASEEERIGDIEPQSRFITVNDLLEKLRDFHFSYQGNVIPDVSDPMDLHLFNSYRFAGSPDSFERFLKLHEDIRGALFEAVKGGGGGQTFISSTKPGMSRGDHFHLNKVERFIVLSGEALVRVRRVMSGRISEYRVKGQEACAIDIPTLHTHSIENVGDGELLTLFWTHEQFDPINPDTFSEKVMPCVS